MSYSKAVRALQAQVTPRNWDDVTEGFTVIGADGEVLLPFTGSRARADRLVFKHPGATVQAVQR